jgi:hypothetical protein
VDAVDEALTILDGTSPTWNGGRFSNHGPMVVETLGRWGHEPDVKAWFGPLLPVWGTAPPRCAPIERDWSGALGVRERYSDWRDFFGAELVTDEWTSVVDRWVGHLAPGYVGHLFHGVIRTAHAVQGLRDHDTPARRQELADALAYWASVYEELPGDIPAAPVTSKLLHDAAATYLQHGMAFPILFMHGITGAGALDRLTPVLSDGRVDQLGRHAAHACAWVAGQGHGDAIPEPPVITPPEQLAAAAIRVGGEHAIKLADACLDAYGATDDELYLVAASDGLVRFENDLGNAAG